jgi:predicted enzyme related to lactoylglutathione lyase
MTIRQNVPAGAPCWVDLMSSDIDRSLAFYGDLFGWTSEAPAEEFGGYRNLLLDGEPVGGLMAHNPEVPPMPDVWSVYLSVADAASTVEAAKAAGSDVIVDPMAVGDLGVMAVITDAGGAVIGLWQPAEHRGGVVATDGAPCHWELWTRDYDGSLDFYERVFGWDPITRNEMPGFRYATLDVADGESAGVMDAASMLPEGVPANWSVYFAVADVAKTLARVEELGGRVVVPAEETPYGVLATASDATGATFKLRGDTT